MLHDYFIMLLNKSRHPDRADQAGDQKLLRRGIVHGLLSNAITSGTQGSLISKDLARGMRTSAMQGDLNTIGQQSFTWLGETAGTLSERLSEIGFIDKSWLGV